MTHYRVIQYLSDQGPSLAKVLSADEVIPLKKTLTTYDLALMAIESSVPLTFVIDSLLSEKTLSYHKLIEDGLVLSPLHHPDQAHTFVTGTGLTHLGSADTRASMHSKIQQDDSTLTDSMKMFKMGIEDGIATESRYASQPEWFYKGNGSIVQKPFGKMPSPSFAQDAGEEPEIVGAYINDSVGNPHRIGFAIGNEFSDHITERHNYLWLAHSKLRNCSFGPELLIGDIPQSLEGTSKILRDGDVIWEKPFVTGESNMSHNIRNLEHHHFKYSLFRHPGDVNIHFFGTSTLSFADSIKTIDGDVFEIEVPQFGRALSNRLVQESQNIDSVVVVDVMY
ncbi:AraD1 family protein [Grimontia sp. NTOU-MAR1]|uniref:AraD1 family protein n=1 Tax=Grimontia sp. NTOU-MAR1 TaxID=3111011 RepID=UPI002DBDF6FE|nr:AraD1 family protein [Grimontia sp. NTOU-MAR1]WRV98191.1 AraD1 family protein [Grimontia sp. NTOU-MAR1]